MCTALAVIACAASVYLPLSVMPLCLAAFCIFLACKRGGVPHGILCAVATVGIMFAMSGPSVKWLFMTIMFAPYGVTASFVQKFDYFKPKRAILRIIIVAAYFNLTLGIIYLIATRVLTSGLDIDFDKWTAMVGGYAVVAVIATAVLVSLDFLFSSLAIVVLKRIPSGEKRDKKPNEKTPTPNETPDADGKKYDIFGYEIKDENDDK